VCRQPGADTTSWTTRRALDSAAVGRILATESAIEGAIDLVSEAIGARLGKWVGVAHTTHIGIVGLALRVRDWRQVRRLELGVANTENRGLPLVALEGKLLIFGSLGRDATRQRDILEDRVILRDGHIDLLISDDLLSLLLRLRELALDGTEVPLVHILNVLRVWIVLRLLLRTIGLELDAVDESVELVDVVTNLLLDDLLQRWAHNLEQERLEETEQKLVVRLLDFDGEVLQLHGDVGDLEEVLGVVLIGSLHGNLEAQASAAEEDIHDSLVGYGREALLPLDVVRDVLQIGLDAGDGQHDLVLVLVLDALAAPAPIVVAAELEKVRCEVVTLQDEVLNDDIGLAVGVLNAWDGYVADVLEEGGKEDFSQVLDQVRLEGGLPVLVVAQIEEELTYVLAEALRDKYSRKAQPIGVKRAAPIPKNQ
jgi:hypothetical protein